MRPFQFINGPWENSELPTIVRESPTGGDPRILATIKRVHNPDDLYELCRLANDMIESRALSSSDPEGGVRGEADALHHLGNVLAILAELHPDDRSNALDDALAFYNARCPNAQVEPVAGVSRLVHQWPGPSDPLTKTPSADHDDGNLRATGGEA